MLNREKPQKETKGHMGENGSIRDQIEKLYHLSDVDAEIYDKKYEKESFPAKISEMNKELEAQRSTLKTFETDLKTLQVRKNEKENDLKAKEEKIKKHETELYQIKSNKEYAALKQEISSIRADVSLLEEEIIILLDKIEDTHSKYLDEKKICEEAEVKAGSEKKILEEKAKVLEEALKNEQIKRDNLAGAIEKDLLERYERILAGRGRSALAVVEGSTCGGCNMTLRPQMLDDAHLKKNVVFCENCSRVLYAKN